MRKSLRAIVAAVVLLASATAWAQESLTITKIYAPTSTDLTLLPGGDVVLAPVGLDVLPGTGYTVNLGRLTKKYLTLHAAELWVETLVAQNTIATIGGRVLVGPTTLLSADLAAAGTTITVKHNNLSNGDRVYLEANASVEFMAITSSAGGSAGAYTYSVTRNLDGSGANDWTAGDAVFNTGQTGNGFIDLYSVRGVNAGTEIGPTIVGNVRTGSTFNAWSPRWAIGNLDGLYGYSGSTYGAAFGTPSAARVTVDSTNGIRIFGGDNDEKVTIDTSGNATFDGAITVGTGRNQLRNSECRVGTDEWTASTNSGLTSTLSFFLGGFSLNNDSNTCYVTITGTPANGTITQVFEGFLHPVAAGTKYEASGYLNAFRTGNTRVDIEFLNAAGTVQVGLSAGSNCAPTAAAGDVLVNYCRSGVIATAPVGAFLARVVIQTTHNGSGLDPYVFFVREYFGEASPSQETFTEWGPAGLTEINNGLIKTDAINARTIAADSITTSELAADSVTSAKIVAGTIVASDIASSTITATQIAAGTITGTQIAATTIAAGNLNVSTLSAITGNMGTLTAGSITGGTIDGATIIAGSGDEVTIDSAGISLQAGTGANNKIKWSDGVTVSAPNSGSTLYVNGGLTVERSINVTGTGAGAAAITVSGGFGIAADTLISPSMASSTGTSVIWEAACSCLKKLTSSLRYKENVMPWHIDGAQRLLNLTPIHFDYRGGAKGVLGLSAEELSLVAPEAVNLDADGRPDSVRTDAVLVYMLQIIKELRAEIDALKAERKQ